MQMAVGCIESMAVSNGDLTTVSNLFVLPIK